MRVAKEKERAREQGGQEEREYAGHCAKRIRYRARMCFQKGVHPWRDAAPGLSVSRKGEGGRGK